MHKLISDSAKQKQDEGTWKWECDVCKAAHFDTEEEAMMHENACLEGAANVGGSASARFDLLDKEFDLDAYQKLQRMKFASYILTVDYLLKGKDKEAVYAMIFGSGLLREVEERGPDYLVKIFKTKRHLAKEVLVPTYHSWFYSTVVSAVSRSDIVEMIGDDLKRT